MTGLRGGKTSRASTPCGFPSPAPSLSLTLTIRAAGQVLTRLFLPSAVKAKYARGTGGAPACLCTQAETNEAFAPSPCLGYGKGSEASKSKMKKKPQASGPLASPGAGKPALQENTAPQTGQVWFIGAGPGAADLITLRGARLIAEADLVLYAGSLVPPEVIGNAKFDATLRDSSNMTLNETHALIKEFALRGQNVARVHTGDPALYGALLEQTRLLDREGIAWHVVPGVSAAFAAAAAAGQSLTLPETRQTLVITRLPGKTPMPEGENLRALAVAGAALAVYLSAEHAAELQSELLAAGLSPDTKVIIGHRVSWPDESIAAAPLSELAQFVRGRKLSRQTMFLVLPGENLNPRTGEPSDPGTASRLYAADFAHGFRKRPGQKKS